VATKCPIDGDDNLRTFASNMYVKSFPKKRDERRWNSGAGRRKDEGLRTKLHVCIS